MSLEQARRQAELDTEVVRLEAEDRAKRAVEEGHTLRPFAITLAGESDLFQHEVSQDAGEGPATAVEILAYGVRAGITPASPRAVALTRSVVVRNLLDDGQAEAVCIALEHAEGLARRRFLPYSRVADTVTWQEPREAPGVPWFFESAERAESEPAAKQ
jgi:hypothetical protein